ncbi:uncharacterized protein LOC120636553 isoform X3 [Pararge aegeria]|uniref:uncharacterized protein LOC120636553 isoform X3 n=1 Tax=Pararge aegeria TaxID=116150 RepID=UPI0019D24BF2|nr:uncharacterized protein LOC120636553 isoform X3 [Pararge aegeria]
MNSRSSVNETNLVNFSADLSTLNQLDSKDGLLSFPFDHIYACHSQTTDRRQALQLEKEIEISAHCVTEDNHTSPEFNRLTEQIIVAENQNKKLKDLLIYHLDLIQQQNELITKRDKLFLALKQENDALKAKLIRNTRRVGFTTRHTIPTSTITSSGEPTTSQIILKSFRDLLPPDALEQTKPLAKELFGIARVTLDPEVPSYQPGEIKVPPVPDKKLNTDHYKMIDNKRSLVKKEVKTENRSDVPLYTVTSNSGNPIIQRIHKNRRKTNSIGSLNRMTKTPKTEIPATCTSKSKMVEQGQNYDRTYGVKSKMINTYANSRSTTTIPKRTMQFTGSLSDRLQLIDTTPTGEDPYQLGEADMREQSPIPKLMLQKTNHGRMKICTDPMGGTPSRRIYDMPDTKSKINRFMSVYEQPKKKPKTIIVQEPDLDLVKTETEIAWPNLYNDKPLNETSLCDFSYGESMLPSLDANEFQELFTSDAALNLDNLNQLDDPPEKIIPEKPPKRRTVRTTSLLVPEEEVVETKRGMGSKRGRKRALSATGPGKQQTPKAPPKPRGARGRGGAAARGKRSPVPDLMTNKPYPTLVGDPDLSWYAGLDPEMKHDDVDPPLCTQASTVEIRSVRKRTRRGKCLCCKEKQS